MKNNFLKRLFVYGALSCFGLSMAFSSAVTIKAEAAVPGTVEPQQQIRKWGLGILYGNQLHKRLYNASTGEWEGDWIFIRILSDEEVEYFRQHNPGMFVP